MLLNSIDADIHNVNTSEEERAHLVWKWNVVKLFIDLPDDVVEQVKGM